MNRILTFGEAFYDTDANSQIILGSGGTADWNIQATCGVNDLKIFVAKAKGPVASPSLVPHPTKGTLSLVHEVNQISDKPNPMVKVCPYMFGQGKTPTAFITTTNQVMQALVTGRTMVANPVTRAVPGDPGYAHIPTCDGKIGSNYYWLDFPSQPSPDGVSYDCSDPTEPYGWSFWCRLFRTIAVEHAGYGVNWVEDWPDLTSWTYGNSANIPWSDPPPARLPQPRPAPLTMAQTGKTPASNINNFYGKTTQEQLCANLCGQEGYYFSKFLSCNPSASFKPTTVAFDRTDSEFSCFCAN